VGAEPAGVETLKNLVLPGIGTFLVLDDKIVTERDLGLDKLK
jgi:amyloid beta precursor protein binding protein 1